MAGKAKPWDLTSTHALEGACEWLRKRSGALWLGIGVHCEWKEIALLLPFVAIFIRWR
jgi:hypothetical protein